MLTPEQTQGPFYIDDHLLRSDIRAGRKGLPLSLHLSVQDVACKPVPNATVELWHADASGVYSGFQSGRGKSFLRGGQITDSQGQVSFTTIYPGWYSGRTTHIHVKVHVAGQVVHTGQLYFKDPITNAVYRHRPYSRHGRRDTTNSQDPIYANGGRQSMLALRRQGTGYVATKTLGVKA
jgi:protocatechuate 3,4-dioxygenase beta subunit